MNSSCIRCATLARRRNLLSAALVAGCILATGPASGQSGPMPVVNPYMAKVRTVAALRPLRGNESDAKTDSAPGRLRPAAIRVAEAPIDASARVRVQSPVELAETKSDRAPAEETPADPAPARITVKSKPIFSPPPVVEAKFASPNEPQPAADSGNVETLAPIISAADFKRNSARKQAADTKAEQSAEPAEIVPLRPLSPWLKDIRRSAPAAADEEVAAEEPTPARASAEEPVETVAQPSRLSVAEETPTLAPIVPAPRRMTPISKSRTPLTRRGPKVQPRPAPRDE